jgi:hypothetical protein
MDAATYGISESAARDTYRPLRAEATRQIGVAGAVLGAGALADAIGGLALKLTLPDLGSSLRLANPISTRLARVIPGTVTPTTLGRPGQANRSAQNPTTPHPCAAIGPYACSWWRALWHERDQRRSCAARSSFVCIMVRRATCRQNGSVGLVKLSWRRSQNGSRSKPIGPQRSARRKPIFNAAEVRRPS